MKIFFKIIIALFKWIATITYNPANLFVYKRIAEIKDLVFKREFFVIPEGNYTLQIVDWKAFQKYNVTHYRKTKGKKIKKTNVDRITLYRTRKPVKK